MLGSCALLRLLRACGYGSGACKMQPHVKVCMILLRRESSSEVLLSSLQVRECAAGLQLLLQAGLMLLKPLIACKWQHWCKGCHRCGCRLGRAWGLLFSVLHGSV